MKYFDNNAVRQIWDDESPSGGSRGLYVAVSGNTGAGKSTMVNALAKKFDDPNVLAINERLFHHPLLKLMFSDPSQYAFWVQVNFMLQRHLCLFRQLALGRTVVMERSHLDDSLFVDYLVEQAYISKAQQEAYIALARLSREALPEPDVWVCLDASAEASVRRVTLAEQGGERPEEFPDEQTKRKFIDGWSVRYRHFFDGITGRDNVIVLDASVATFNLVEAVWPKIVLARTRT